MVKEIIQTKEFIHDLGHVKDKNVKKRIFKQIAKLTRNPDLGKPLKYRLMGERTLYIKPFRLIYASTGDKIILLRFQYRKKVYQ